MKKNLFFLFWFALCLASASAAESTNRLYFPGAGFTIAPLELQPGDLPQQALIMFLPATDGFAPNVNVQIQPYPGTLDDYVAFSLQQFKSMGVKLLEQKNQGKTVALFEYTGEIQARALHCYARAEKSGASVYLVTATASPLQWNKESARLKSCVESFRCERGEQAPQRRR